MFILSISLILKKHFRLWQIVKKVLIDSNIGPLVISITDNIVGTQFPIRAKYKDTV